MRWPLLLHGFLGCKEDWDPFLRYVKAIAIDWSGEEEILPFAGRPLIGYSMGGRVALHVRKHFSPLILISAHLGLNVDREERRRQDEMWARKLETCPLPQVLSEWYAQPLFQSLRAHPDFPQILQRREQIEPKKAASMLKRYSLSHQPSYSQLDSDVFLIYGERDAKYKELYSSFQNSFEILGAGHAIHLEQPQRLAETIQKILSN